MTGHKPWSEISAKLRADPERRIQIEQREQVIEVGLMQGYSIVERPPTVKEFQALRLAVGWGEADEDAIAKSIPNSLYWVSLLKEEKVIGCGRVVGDGGLCFYLQDLIVLPMYQGQGLGHLLMEKLMEYVRANAHRGGFVGLMAARGAEDFYLKYGFMKRPTSEYGPGMILFWK